MRVPLRAETYTRWEAAVVGAVCVVVLGVGVAVIFGVAVAATRLVVSSFS